jgi:N-methylhydantoinase B
VLRVSLNPIEISLFSSRIEAVCDEMGAVLRRTAFSPNIKDRLDFSCAVFDAKGQLSAQAAHIPVHLGSMAYAMADVVANISWQPGDNMLVLNDPFLGGTHLPDVTVIAPVFIGAELMAYVANRAHHANIGSDSPGSMPIATELAQEGIVIAPTLLVKQGNLVESVMTSLCGSDGSPQSRGDFCAQISANLIGVARLSQLIGKTQPQRYQQLLQALNDYGERLARATVAEIPNGVYRCADVLDDDGCGHTNIPINAVITVDEDNLTVDFAGTAAQVSGNINCPLPVTAAAVLYVFRCLMPDHTPACAGSFRPVAIRAPKRSLVNAERPAAVAAGNVETSSRLVDVVLGALAQAIPAQIPAASQGTMNNIALGAMASANSPRWDYYETVGGGGGASMGGPGLSGLQCHMTNTLNTPVESLEKHYPLRINRYALRPNSGGKGDHDGGDGVVREFEFLRPAQISLLTERRTHTPWGLRGGDINRDPAAAGDAGENRLNGELLPGKCQIAVAAGDVLSLATPGGGGWSRL